MTVAVVTGASRGIGKAIAIALARRGVHIELVARASEELEASTAEVRALGVQARSHPRDLSRPGEVSELARVLLERPLSAGAVPEVLVNNAATIVRAPVEDTSLADYNAQLDLNLRAPFLLCAGLLPAMRAAGRGRILNVSSISATLGTAGAAAYCASKWGLVGWTKSLAEELSGSGLMTLALLPGSVDTRMLRGSGFEPRLTPEEVATTLVFFALDAPLSHNGALVEHFGV